MAAPCSICGAMTTERLVVEGAAVAICSLQVCVCVFAHELRVVAAIGAWLESMAAEFSLEHHDRIARELGGEDGILARLRRGEWRWT